MTRAQIVEEMAAALALQDDKYMRLNITWLGHSNRQRNHYRALANAALRAL